MENITEYMTNLRANTWSWEYNAPHPLSILPFEDPSLFYSLAHRKDHFALSVGIGLLYILIIFSLHGFMKGKHGLELKIPLFLWNLGLGLFSIVGFIRTAPSLVFAVSTQDGFYNSVCLRKYVDVATIFWSFLFIFSKIVELGDTVFIVLRKRPLIFLQWYHHVATMIYTFTIAMTLMEPIQRWHMVLNFGVHSLMYPYFALRTVGVQVWKPIANAITTLQFLQMIIGVVINLASSYYLYRGHECVRYPVSIQASFVLYGSFFLLFGKLFADSVLRRGHSKKLKGD